MSRKISTVCVLLMACCLTLTGVEASPELQVENAVICTGIEDRSPVGANSQFFEEAERLFCFSHLTGGAPGDTVSHVWYFEGDEKARVELPVKSPSWRTWSSKRLIDAWSGSWRVEILSPEGAALDTLEFVYKPMAE